MGPGVLKGVFSPAIVSGRETWLPKAALVNKRSYLTQFVCLPPEEEIHAKGEWGGEEATNLFRLLEGKNRI